MKYLFLIVSTCLISFGALADAKTEILMDKVERMEAELSLIQRKLYQTPNLGEMMGTQTTISSTENGPANIDELYSQIDSQNQLIQDLTQKVEQLEFELNTLENKLNKINQDVDFRLNELGKQKSSESSGVNEVKNGSDKEAYEAAYALLKKGEYEGAEQAFLNVKKSKM